MVRAVKMRSERTNTSKQQEALVPNFAAMLRRLLMLNPPPCCCCCGLKKEEEDGFSTKKGLIVSGNHKSFALLDNQKNCNL
jgi:hypothetical protein